MPSEVEATPALSTPAAPSPDVTMLPGRGRRPQTYHAYLFVAPYAIMLAALGVAPAGYAAYLAFTKVDGGFAGLGNFTQASADYRFAPAFIHAFTYVGIWVGSLLVFVVGLALLLFRRGRVSSGAFRVLYYLPGAFAGAASVLVWLFMLSPSVSPVATFLHLLDRDSLASVLAPGDLPIVFALIAFWTGAGAWILVMIGGLNNIPRELTDAARIDGANSLQQALFIELPLLRKWIAYMVILAFAGGTQLFVEPQLVGAASLGLVSQWWSPNQLAYVYAFQQGNFSVAAAISVELLLLGMICAAIIIVSTRLFAID
jgi:multiple sugar transport system permease protein